MTSATAASATILIVDDQLQNRKLLETLLRREVELEFWM
jgi:CheY-like chemotaxis protein